MGSSGCTRRHHQNQGQQFSIPTSNSRGAIIIITSWLPLLASTPIFPLALCWDSSKNALPLATQKLPRGSGRRYIAWCVVVLLILLVGYRPTTPNRFSLHFPSGNCTASTHPSIHRTTRPPSPPTQIIRKLFKWSFQTNKILPSM